jgi:tRNA-(ms[2]io[6]A)-hydroxylase
MLESNLPLRGTTPSAWAQHIIEHFDLFLLDHASCERKAAALAMSFVAKYSDRRFLIEPMVSLAREELDHFAQVYRLLTKRGIIHLPPDERDDYVRSMLKRIRHGREENFLDRLVVSGMIEARGWERFSVLAEHLEEESLKTFYSDLAKREKGHYRIFLNIAEKYFTQEEVSEAVSRIADYECEAMLQAPLTSRLH